MYSFVRIISLEAVLVIGEYLTSKKFFMVVIKIVIPTILIFILYSIAFL